MLISIPHGYRGCEAFCSCRCDGETGHDCFAYANEAKLRGYCPPCFEAQFVDQAREIATKLHNVYHEEMTALNGWRIKNEKSFDKVALLEERFKEERCPHGLLLSRMVCRHCGNDRVEVGGNPWPRNRFGLDKVV